MSEDSTEYGTQRRRLLQTLTAGGAILASSQSLATETGDDTASTAMQQHHAANHYHKFLVGHWKSMSTSMTRPRSPRLACIRSSRATWPS